MAKITMTADEEYMYLHELDKIRELIPELEVHIINQPVSLNALRNTASEIGDEFKQFLKTSAATVEKNVE